MYLYQGITTINTGQNIGIDIDLKTEVYPYFHMVFEKPLAILWQLLGRGRRSNHINKAITSPGQTIVMKPPLLRIQGLGISWTLHFLRYWTRNSKRLGQNIRYQSGSFCELLFLINRLFERFFVFCRPETLCFCERWMGFTAYSSESLAEREDGR